MRIWEMSVPSSALFCGPPAAAAASDNEKESPFIVSRHHRMLEGALQDRRRRSRPNEPKTQQTDSQFSCKKKREKRFLWPPLRLEKKRKGNKVVFILFFPSGFEANFLSAAFVGGEFSGGFENVSAPISCYFIWEIWDYRSLGLFKIKKLDCLLNLFFYPNYLKTFSSIYLNPSFDMHQMYFFGRKSEE